MANGSAPQQQKRKKRSVRSRILIVFSILFVVLAVSFVALGLYINEIDHQFVSTTHTLTPAVNASLGKQYALFYNGTHLIPYANFMINTTNTETVGLTINYFQNAPPGVIYVLNWSNQCFNCKNTSTIVLSLKANLTKYDILNGTTQLRIISPQALGTIPPGSVLVILNNLLPDYMLNNYNGYSTLLEYLFNQGTTVIYVGGNFNNLVASQSVSIPNQNIPAFLASSSTNPSGSAEGFYFNKPTYSVVGSQAYGPVTYKKVDQGNLVVFANYQSAWATQSQIGADIATAIYDEFWVPRYTYGYQSYYVINQTRTTEDRGIFLLPIPNLDISELQHLNSNTYARAAFVAKSPNGKLAYYNLYFQPSLSVNGSISLPSLVSPGIAFNTTVTVGVPTQQLIEPHIDIYSSNLTLLETYPPTFSKQASPPAYSYIQQLSFELPPGGYIAQVDGYVGQHYTAGYFVVPPLDINLASANENASTYTFSFTSQGHPLNNINISISLDNKYNESTVIQNGTVIYSLPSGVSAQKGAQNFTLSLLGTTYLYRYIYNPVVVYINQQYIEFIIALMIVIIEVTLVRAPVRDEFYIDVPSLPRTEKVQTTLKFRDVLGVFDKLNIYYKWRFMPLSKSEFRFAVSNNVRVNSMPVTLTYNNIDLLLDELTAKGYLISAGDLYAPRAWVEQSKHDIEYLSTFKKMRVYLVSHGHIFTDLDKSDVADIVTTLHNEKAYIVIYSKSSRFMKNLPIQPNVKTYLAFMNGDKMEEFKRELYTSTTRSLEEIKMYLSVGSITLIDAENPEGILT